MNVIDTTDNGGLPAFLDRRPLVGSYTLLNTFKNVCEHQAYRRYVKRDQKYVETEAMKWGNEVHEAFENRVGKGKVFPDHMRQFEKHATPFDSYVVLCEQKLGITAGGTATGFFDKDVWFRGKNDITVMVNDKGLLTDIKTGSSKYEDSFELKTNALLIKAKYPNLRTIVGRYIYVGEDKISQMYDLSDFQATWIEINRLMSLIAEKRQSGVWEKNKSGLCGWCSVEDCENHYVAKK